MEVKFYTSKEVAAILKVHQYTVLKWIREGRLNAISFGRSYRVVESELAAFLGQTAHITATQNTVNNTPIRNSTEVSMPLQRPEPKEGSRTSESGASQLDIEPPVATPEPIVGTYILDI